MTSPQTIDLLLTRRSVPAKTLTGPGPDAGQLKTILTIAARVPDHAKLVPWRFIVIAGESCRSFGELVAGVRAAANPATGRDALIAERARFAGATHIVAVVSRAARGHKIPEWEQILSAGAVTQNMLVAAAAMGFAGQWLTGWYAYDRDVLARLGLSAGERIAGYVFLGTASKPPGERPRPQLDEIVTHWTGS